MRSIMSRLMKLSLLSVVVLFAAAICSIPAAEACEPDCAIVEPECTEEYETERKWKISSVRTEKDLCGDGEDFLYLSWEVWCLVPSCKTIISDTEINVYCASLDLGDSVGVQLVEKCEDDNCAQLCGWEPCDSINNPQACNYTVGLGEDIIVTTEVRPEEAQLPEMDEIVQVFILFANSSQQTDYAVSEDLRNECASCDPDYIKDECGVCGGDGSSCKVLCIEEQATSKEKSTSRKVIRKAKVLKNRVKKFDRIAEECGGKVEARSIKRANRLLKQIRKTLSQEITNTVLVCTNSICSQASTGDTKRKLKKLNRRLTKLAKSAKRHAVSVCQTKRSAGDKRPKTEDYSKDVNNAIDNLPGEKLSC
jgi:hypothetical protein